MKHYGNVPAKEKHLPLLLLTLIPILMFLIVFGVIIYQSIPAMVNPGFSVLFSLKFSNPYSFVYTPGEFGMTPALFGSLELLFIALLIALPFSLLIAVLATEYSLKGIGRILEPILALFSGIPPILYGLLSVFVLVAFFRPKFVGVDLPETEIMKMPGLPEWSGSILPRNYSDLLAGILIGLLIIPFMAPLIIDAIRNVPQNLKEASIALGATRWYTLWRVILPSSASGIAAAISLGALKTIGEVVIAAWTVGYVADGLPNPFFDVLEAKAPLTSAAAGLYSGMSPGGTPRSPTDASVAYFSGLLLMIIAFVILILVEIAQRAIRRRFHP